MPLAEPTTENISISVLRTDGGTQMRAGLDDAKTKEYAEIVKTALDEAEAQCPAGANLLDYFRHPFPPIEVIYDGKHYWTWDGAHRRQAYVVNNIPVINTAITPGTRRDAIYRATGANKHGLAHSPADRRRAINVLLDDPEWASMSNYEIARHTGANERTVRNIRKERTNPTHATTKGDYDNLSDSGAESAYGLTPALRDELEAYAPDALEAVRQGEMTPKQAGLVAMQRKAKAGKGEAPVEDEEPSGTARTTEGGYLSDDDWMKTIPAYRVLKEKPHKGLSLRNDALTYRVLQNSKVIGGFKHAIAQEVNLKDGGSTPMTRVFVEAALLPDPQDWKVCTCGGDGCDRCNHTGYSLYAGKEV